MQFGSWRNPMLRNACSLVVLALVGLSGVARAEGLSPVGRWQTVDDGTKEPKSIVRLWEKDGVIFGRIEVLFPKPGEPANPVCDRCEGAQKNKPIVGMTFLWGLKRSGDGWSGGRVLDPENGKVYRCSIKVIDGGRRLKVRGYVGVSLLGRTQVWQQVRDERPLVN
jgi:uncharacterized protein (DUF2147 family)